MGRMQRNSSVFLMDKCVLEIIYAAGYPSNRHMAVDMAARNMESHNMFMYKGAKNFMKFSSVNCIVVRPFDSFVVML